MGEGLEGLKDNAAEVHCYLTFLFFSPCEWQVFEGKLHSLSCQQHNVNIFFFLLAKGTSL